VLRSPRDYAAVKRALAAAGYKGEKIVVMAPTDVSELGNLTRTGAEHFGAPGMSVDLQEMDFGSVVRRRGNQSPPDKGGYNMFSSLIDRSLPTFILTATWPSAPTARSL
jgi:peptide/nickel transport system substrate-binding protein